MSIWIVSGIILLLNIPFGFWREYTRKYSFRWLIAIHIPVLIGIGIKYQLGIGFSWITLPLFLFVFLVGQFIGSRINRFLNKSIKTNNTPSIKDY